MIVWVSELDLEVFKESLDISKEFCGRLDENGKTLDRGFNFHIYRGQHFALSMSMQAVEISKDRVFKTGGGLYWIMINLWGSMKLAVLGYPEDGSDPITNMVLEVPLQQSQETTTFDVAEAEKFKKGGIPSMSAFIDI